MNFSSGSVASFTDTRLRNYGQLTWESSVIRKNFNTVIKIVSTFFGARSVATFTVTRDGSYGSDII